MPYGGFKEKPMLEISTGYYKEMPLAKEPRCAGEHGKTSP